VHEKTPGPPNFSVHAFTNPSRTACQKLFIPPLTNSTSSSVSSRMFPAQIFVIAASSFGFSSLSSTTAKAYTAALCPAVIAVTQFGFLDEQTAGLSTMSWPGLLRPVVRPWCAGLRPQVRDASFPTRPACLMRAIRVSPRIQTVAFTAHTMRFKQSVGQGVLTPFFGMLFGPASVAKRAYGNGARLHEYAVRSACRGANCGSCSGGSVGRTSRCWRLGLRIAGRHHSLPLCLRFRESSFPIPCCRIPPAL
jgi:hypothetical protein